MDSSSDSSSDEVIDLDSVKWNPSTPSLPKVSSPKLDDDEIVHKKGQRLLDSVFKDRIAIVDGLWKDDKKQKETNSDGILLFSESQSTLTGRDLEEAQTISTSPPRPKYAKIEDSSSDSEDKVDMIADAAIDFNFTTNKFEVSLSKKSQSDKKKHKSDKKKHKSDKKKHKSDKKKHKSDKKRKKRNK